MEIKLKFLSSLSTPNPLTRATLFGQIFEELPTYEELKNGTPKIRQLYALNQAFNEGQDRVSGAEGTRTLDLPRDRRTL